MNERISKNLNKLAVTGWLLSIAGGGAAVAFEDQSHAAPGITSHILGEATPGGAEIFIYRDGVTAENDINILGSDVQRESTVGITNVIAEPIVAKHVTVTPTS